MERKVKGAVTDLHLAEGPDPARSAPAPAPLTSQAGISEAAQAKAQREKLPLGLLCPSLNLPSVKK